MAEFTNKDVAGVIGINPRLVQYYTNQGVIVPAVGGGKRGQSWTYSKEHLIEFGIIKEMAGYGMPLQKIKDFFEYFRKPAFGFLDRYRRRIIRSGEGPLDSFLICFYNAESKDIDIVFIPGTDKPMPGAKEVEKYGSWIVINVGRIIAKVEAV